MTEDEIPIATKKKKIKIRYQNQERSVEVPCQICIQNPSSAPAARIERVQSEAVDIGARDAA